MKIYAPLFPGVLLFLIFFSTYSFAQMDVRSVSMAKLNELKKNGQLNGTEKYTNYQSHLPAAHIVPPSPNEVTSLCNCWIERDGSWQIGQFDYQGANGGPGIPPEYRNDDWSTNAIALPFNFCFYGQTINSVYLNNNGNISIGATYSTFTANSFPDPTFVMIAPFWADVDTRAAGSGLVYYKVTPTHAIFQWENVGYFNIYDDKLNTFQLIITDGNDTIIPPGDNVSFCYMDMQWTTGDASSGVNGFGGTPATVGINQGNGIDYIQVGLYDQPGNAWDGPYGNNDGIDALDNQSYFFNCCFSNSNIPPIIRSTAVCDTFHLCIGDTVLFDADYLSPEPGQVTTASVNTNGVTGINVLQQTTGNVAHIQIQIIASSSNVGYNTIYLIGTDNGVPAQTTSTPIVVSVQPSPIAAATYLPASPVMPGTPITFTNTSTGLFNNWDFDDGTTSTTLNPVHTYNLPGTYYVTLVTMNPNGCTDTLILPIEVVNCVTVNVVAATSACEGDVIAFTYQGNASGAAIYNWNFGTGTILSGSNSGPINVMWNTAGTYNVTLEVTDNGCTSNPVTTTVTVNPNPVAAFISQPVLCAGDTASISFNGTAIGGATYNWFFQNGTTISGSGQGPINVSWSSAGTDSIGLIVTQNGCSDTSGSSILINPAPTSSFTVPSGVCENGILTVSYTGSAGTSAVYNWNFGSAIVHSGTGQGPYTISWNTAGTFTISLSVIENGCSSPLTTSTVAVNAIPSASISATPSLCVGDQNTVIFTGTAGGTATYTWNFGNATVISGSGAGPYTLTWQAAINDLISLVVDDHGCTDSTTFAVAINPLPNSPFTLPPDVCAGNDVTVSYTGTASATATYNWNFGGATIISGSGQGPYVINWNIPGNPIVSLTVTENGCTSPITSNGIIVTPGPVSNFTAAPILCAGDQNFVTFNGNASGTATWNWDFGSATIISGTGVGPYTIQYQSAGNFNINLIVSDNGCADTSSFEVLVQPVPSSTFIMPASVCIGDPVTVTYTGSGTSAATYIWNFGNATVQSGSGQGPYSLLWSSSGSQNITLSVSENNCVSPVTSSQIFIADYPLTFAGMDTTVCSGTSVAVGLSPETGVTYQWSPAANIAEPDSSSTHVITDNTSMSSEVLHFVLTATNLTGCITTDEIEITVNPVPEVFFSTPAEQCFENNEFSFVADGTHIPGASYTWSFGNQANPSTSSAENPSAIIYSSAGNFPVILNAVYNNCPAIPYTDSVVIHISPVADFTPLVLEGCEPLEVPLINLSTGDQNIYSWHFTDGNQSMDENPTNVFLDAGTYSISLQATTQYGCTNEITYNDIIIVHPTPVANFTPHPETTTLLEPIIHFNNTSLLGDVYEWQFGDNSGSNDFSPSHEYKDTGTYFIDLFVSTQNGCIDTISATVRVEKGFTFYIPNAFTPNGDGSNDFFKGLGTSIKTYEMRIFDRWGINIYTTESYDHPWDGRINDTPVQSDVYIYKIWLTDIFDIEHEYIGNVTLVR